MAKVLKCGDLNPGCNFEARGNSEDEVLKKAAEHAKTAHNMDKIPPDVLSKARNAIHDEGGKDAKKAGA
jgi:predicted small metal-binding protein